MGDHPPLNQLGSLAFSPGWSSVKQIGQSFHQMLGNGQEWRKNMGQVKCLKTCTPKNGWPTQNDPKFSESLQSP